MDKTLGITPDGLEGKISLIGANEDKLKTAGQAAAIAGELEGRGGKMVFTNGCFDLIHAGHVRYLIQARGLGDYLVVGLNSDASVQKIKGPLRPLIPQDQRAEVMAGLWMVDAVVIFDEPDPLELILTIRPHVLVKGADWAEKDIVGAKEVRSWGGDVGRIPLLEGVSTTGIIQSIIRRCS